MRWIIRLTLLAIAVGYVVLIGFDGKFYYPDNKSYFDPTDLNLAVEDIWFTTSDGVRLHGWFIKSQGQSRGMIVHFHGNAANITNHIAAVAWIPSEHYDVLMFDYRGFGRSDGRVTREGTIRDGLAAVDYALTRPEYQPGKLFAYGQSLGGAVATVVTAERPEIRAAVLEATFSGYRRIGAEHLRRLIHVNFVARFIAWAGLSGDYDPIDYVSRISPRPLLIIAGGNDTLCFPELGRDLFDAAGEPKEFVLVEGAQHFAAVPMGGRELEQKIIHTFEQGAKATPE
ncbi:MAG: alpha/beta hydrolase [Phycisphaerae bacterium]|nr:alpha/beta hydrolase [Phycisphaerae bacterium]